MKTNLFILTFSFISTLLFSQSLPMAFEDWKTTAGSQNFFYKNITKTDASGNVYIAGATLNAAGNTDILLAKYSPNGVQLWIQQYAGAGNGVDFAADLVVTTTDVYVTGAVTTSTSSPTTDAITMRYSSAGVLQWATIYNGAGNLYDAGKSIVLDASSNIYITGGTYNAAGNTDFVTLKYSPTGAQQWVSTYNYTSNLDDVGIKIVAQGTNVIVTGAVTNTTSNYKFGTFKLAQSTGSVTGSNISAAITTVSVDAVADLATDVSGNIYVVGSNYVTGQGSNYYVQKMNSSLVTAWTYTYNGASSLNDVCRAVMVDATGNVFITGYSTITGEGRNIATMKLNSSGAIQWTQLYNDSYNGDDEAADMVLDASSNVYITGYNTNSLNKKDYYTIKYNSSGTKQWDVISDGVSLNDNATNIALDASNNVIVTGQSETSPSTFNFLTVKYVQYDILVPVDYGTTTEPFSSTNLYYPNTVEVKDTSGTNVTDVLFYTKHTFPKEYVFGNKIAFCLSKQDTKSATPIDTMVRVDMVFNKTQAKQKVYPFDVQENNGVINYLLPSMGVNGKTNVKGASRLIIPNIYPNIDLHYYSNQKGLKYYFVVKPGADPKAISITFNGASSTSLSASNELQVNTKLGNFSFKKPKIFNLNGILTTTATGTSGWVSAGVNTYTINTGTYNTSLPLIIEIDKGKALAAASPTDNLTWSTYFGDIENDAISQMKSDAAKNLYIIGNSSSSVLPNVFGVSVFQHAYNGTQDGFVAKFNPIGVLLWETYIGGSGQDNLNGFDIANAGAGDLYCVGNTKSTNLLYNPKPSATLVNKATHSAGSNFDGFVFQLQQNGYLSNWLTYYGGTDEDYFNACKFDSNGNLLIVGTSRSTTLSIVGTAPTYTAPYIGGGFANGYILKLNATTFNIDWSTYIGTSLPTFPRGDDYLGSLDFNSLGDIFVGGASSGIDYPVVSAGSLDTYTYTNNGYADGIITRFDKNGKMLWSSYFGGLGTDGINAIKTDGNELYFGGYTTDFITFNTKTSPKFFNNTIKATYPSFPSYLSAEGGFFVNYNQLNQLTHSTLIGAGGQEQVDDIVVDATHNVYITGRTTSANLDLPPSGNPANTWSINNTGGYDFFIFTMQPNNPNPIWTTQIGGSSDDFFGGGAYIDANNNLYVLGSPKSNLVFPWNDGGGAPVWYQNYLAGSLYNLDGSITRLKLSPINFVGIEENPYSNNVLLLFPNPAQNSITVQLANFKEKATYTVYNNMGQIITYGNLLTNNTTLNLSEFSAGIYLIEITDKTNRLTTKFIKQ